MEKVLIGGGSGLVGQRLTELLIERGYEVAHLSRKKSDGDIKTIVWDVKKMSLDASEIKPYDHIINLAGAGIADKPWTTDRKQELLDSRIKSTDLLVGAMAQNASAPKSFICASAVGYYGFHTSEHIFEEEDESGNDFLADICKKWEESANRAKQHKVPTATIRIGLVLSKKGGALKELVNPVKFGLGAALGPGKQYMQWIHIDDLCLLFIHALENKLVGAYNAAAPNQVNNREFTRILSKVLRKPFWMPNVPAFVLSIILGSRKVLVLEGSRVSPEKIQKAGFQFKFSFLKEALEDIFA